MEKPQQRKIWDVKTSAAINPGWQDSIALFDSFLHLIIKGINPHKKLLLRLIILAVTVYPSSLLTFMHQYGFR